MDKVFLIGDSIRQGYDKYTRLALSGEAEVYYPADNCRFAKYVLRNAHEWIGRDTDPMQVTVVHWNAGLWDTLRLFGDEMLTPLEEYVATLRRVDKRLRIVCPNAKLIFATSTRVQEKLYGDKFRRYNADIERYNAAACELMEELHVQVNDLYAVTKTLDESAWSDMTHLYTEVGTNALGGAVCAAIRRALAE